MTDTTGDTGKHVTGLLADGGYWPALAAREFAAGRYSRAVEICKAHLPSDPHLISGRLIYARALFHAGQSESAAEEFYRVLARDPDNQVALKYLADMQFQQGDEIGAMASYQRILELDPLCSGLKSVLRERPKEITRTITFRQRNTEGADRSSRRHLREIPILTETIGDLYLKQGYPRLAAEVFRSLSDKNDHPRLAEKLALANKCIKERET